MKHLDIRIHGRVQGVLFRDSALKRAEELGLAGFITNEPDGSLYIEVEGDEKSLNEFSIWCSEGPPLADVEKIEHREGEWVGYKSFEIR